jgi:ParB-like chromosome segregation protein Spo0J
MSGTIELCKVQHYVAVDKLKTHPDNPRTIKIDRLEALKDSIIQKGFYQPILVWKKNGVVLAGNHRLMAVRELIAEGYEFKSPDGKGPVLPVVIEDVEDDVAEAILFETNNSYADWVEDKLRSALEKAEADGHSVIDFGFTQDFVDNLLNSALKDADDIAKESERDIEPVDADKLASALAEEEFESLILPKASYERLMALLGEVAKTLDKEWIEGDPLAPAVDALCQAAFEADLMSDVMRKKVAPKEEEKPKKGKKK